MIKQLLKNRMPGLVALLVLMVMVMSPTKALAYDFEVDGIYYNKISDTEVKVTENEGGTDYSGHIIIPESVVYNGITFSVTTIGDYAFSDCSSLTSISIPESVTSIGDYAFYYCSSLSSLSIPESVTMIGDYVFAFCYTLTSLSIPASVTTIGGSAFRSCSSLTSLSIPASVTTIGDGAFSYCSSLKEIIVEQDNIGYKSYNGVVYNSDLTKLLIVPGGLEDKFVIPNSVTMIGDYAFRGCSSLTSLSIPESVTSIGDYAFGGCSSLTSLSIPNSVSSIGDYAFSSCSSLTSLSIPNSVSSIGDYAFRGCSSLTSLSIPNSVTSIGDAAFEGCSSLTSLSIPNSVSSIGDYAFYCCSSLSSLSIPESVTLIGDCAFEGCSLLKSVGCLAIVPPSIGMWWDGVYWPEYYTQVDILYVPAESVDAYKNSDWGRYFPKIVELGITIDIKGNGKVYADDYDVISSDTKFYDRNYKFLFVPDAGNRIASITVDGEDVSANLNEHNVWTLKDYNGYGTLKVVFAPEAETSLTVKGMESHSLIHYYKEGERAKIDIVPEDGWQLYSLRFNGEDVTSEVVGNTYITPALSGANNIEVVMQKGGNDGVEDIQSAARTILFRKNGSGVEILNLDEDENISIYNAAGVLQYQGTNHKMTLSPNEVYILRTHRETLKFAL